MSRIDIKISIMIHIKRIGRVVGVLLLFIIHTQCASSQPVEMKTQIQIKDAYFQEILSGIKDGPSGFMIYIEVNESSNIQFTEAYFKGKKVKLNHKTNTQVYTGRYMSQVRIPDLIMSDDPKKEFKNQLPEIEEKIPFDLKENECILRYIKNEKEGYFKIDTLKEKFTKNIPM